MDNFGLHKVAGIHDVFGARGARARCLPAYSLDLNPIDQVFAKLKKLLRAEATLSVEELRFAIGALFGCFTPAKCQNYPQHCGHQHSV